MALRVLNHGLETQPRPRRPHPRTMALSRSLSRGGGDQALASAEVGADTEEARITLLFSNALMFSHASRGYAAWHMASGEYVNGFDALWLKPIMPTLSHIVVAPRAGAHQRSNPQP